DAWTASRAGVAVGHEPGSLLVTREDVAHRRLARQGIIQRRDLTAGEAKNGLHAVVPQTAYQGVGDRSLGGGFSNSSLSLDSLIAVGAWMRGFLECGGSTPHSKKRRTMGSP